MEYLFHLGWLDVARAFYTSLPLDILLIGVPVAAAAYVAFRARGALSRRFWAALVAVTLAPALAPLAIAYSGGGLGYWVAGCTLHVKAGSSASIPLAEANVSLVSYQRYRPVARVWGVGVPGLAYGRVVLRGGVRALALVYKPGSRAILIRYPGGVVLIAHPGVEKVYGELLRLHEACVEGSG